MSPLTLVGKPMLRDLTSFDVRSRETVTSRSVTTSRDTVTLRSEINKSKNEPWRYFKSPPFFNGLSFWSLAVWKIIKTMLPSEGVERIRFTTKDGILDYVDRQNLAKYMGGEDPYVYNYEKGKPLGERCPRVSHPKVVIPP